MCYNLFKPIKIDDLARDLIRLSGLEPDVDVQVVYTGLRPGEKLYEEMFLDKGNLCPTKHQKIVTLKTVKDRQTLAQEVQALKGIIKWESEPFNKLMDWMIGSCQEDGTSSETMTNEQQRPRTAIHLQDDE